MAWSEDMPVLLRSSLRSIFSSGRCWRRAWKAEGVVEKRAGLEERSRWRRFERVEREGRRLVREVGLREQAERDKAARGEVSMREQDRMLICSCCFC